MITRLDVEKLTTEEIKSFALGELGNALAAAEEGLVNVGWEHIDAGLEVSRIEIAWLQGDEQGSKKEYTIALKRAKAREKASLKHLGLLRDIKSMLRAQCQLVA